MRRGGLKVPALIMCATHARAHASGARQQLTPDELHDEVLEARAVALHARGLGQDVLRQLRLVAVQALQQRQQLGHLDAEEEENTIHKSVHFHEL